MRNDVTNFPNFGEMESDIMQYAQQFSADQLARPGALAECYHRVLGVKRVEELSTKAARVDGPETSGRPASTREPDPDAITPATTRLSDRETSFATRGGTDPFMFKQMQGSGRYSIDEFQADKAKVEAASKKRRNRA